MNKNGKITSRTSVYLLTIGKEEVYLAECSFYAIATMNSVPLIICSVQCSDTVKKKKIWPFSTSTKVNKLKLTREYEINALELFGWCAIFCNFIMNFVISHLYDNIFYYSNKFYSNNLVQNPTFYERKIGQTFCKFER